MTRHTDLQTHRQTNGKPLRLGGLAAVLALVMAVSACSKQEQGGAPPQGGPAPQVGVHTVSSQRLPITTELAGRTQPFQIAEVRPQVGGIVKERLFREGSDVRAGTPLYQIDAAVYQVNRDVAVAALAKAEANLASTRVRARRYEELASIQAVSQQDRDDAVTAVRQAEADVAVSKANLESTRINLAYTQVTAPISGRIGKSSVTAGALVTANQAAALTTIQQLDPMYVDVTQSSAELLRLRRDLAAGRLQRAAGNQARVKLMLEDGSAYAHEGKLAFSDVTVDQSTGTVTLRALFPNPDKVLLPGMYVRAVLEEGVREDALVVPQQGVTRDAKGNATALVVNAEGKVELRILKTQRALGNQWLVNEGLQAGDRVIVEGVQRARPGAQVNAVPAGASAPAAAK